MKVLVPVNVCVVDRCAVSLSRYADAILVPCQVPVPIVPNFVIEVKLDGVMALTVSVPVVTSALVAISITPGFVAEAASAETVTAPVVLLTSIPAPATTEVTLAAVYVVEIEVPCQVPVPIVPNLVIEVKLEGVIALTVSVPAVTSALVAISMIPFTVALASGSSPVLVPLKFEIYVVDIALPCHTPVAIVPKVVILELPAQVERAVFSTLPKPTSALVVACALKFG